MPAPQLFCAALEVAINQALSMDPDCTAKLDGLQQRQLQCQIQELPWPIRFHFADAILVSSPEPDSPSADCSLGLSLATLPALRDGSQITQLLKTDKLTLEGDIQVAQQFSQLMQQLDIDWEEQLAKRVGDVPAHRLFQGLQDVGQKLQQHWLQGLDILKDFAVEERPIAAPALGVIAFSDEVHELRGATERLEQRIAQLERQLQHN